MKTTSPARQPDSPDLEVRITAAGQALLNGMGGVIDSLDASGPQQLAGDLGIDKVLASRVLKMARSTDPLAAVHRAPGPAPLRRVIKASARRGVEPDLISIATEAVDRFEELIRGETGDRSSLDAVLSAWVPEARREFEMRRKQAAFRALSQLKGVEARTIVATVFLHPSRDGQRIDIVWASGLIGLHRLRPSAPVKFATRKFASETEQDERRPRSLAGEPLEGLEGGRLDDFCSTPLPPIDIHRVGEVVHYTLADGGFGRAHASDLIFAEVDRSELPRRLPASSPRKRYVFAEASLPARVLQLDAFVHQDLFTGPPDLQIYDTALDGIADANDRARDIDRFDMLESIESLGKGVARARSDDVPRYNALTSHVCDSLGWDGAAMHGFRCRIEYPVYGSQVTMLFEPERLDPSSKINDAL